MTETKRVFKWWQAWNPEVIENWLEAQEAEGWHLVKIERAATRFYFEKGEPRQIRYCADFQNKKDPNYMSIFQDAGWEFMYTGSGWFIWRMPYSGTRPDIYSDLDSLIERNNRLSGLFVVLLCAQIPIMSTAINTLMKFPYFFIVYIFLYGIILYCLLRLIGANSKLKKKRDGLK